MNFIDSHTHLHDSRISSMLDNILQRADQKKVAYMASCATMIDNFDRTMHLSRENDSILPFFGIHPWFLDGLTKDWPNILADTLSMIPSGVGETGLDFVDKRADRDFQLAVFLIHLDLARQLNRPINIHVRKAWDDFIHILKKTGPLPVPGMIHSYSGSADMIPIFEKYNLYISFSGSVTNPGAKKVVAAIRAVPLSRIVLETDTPDIFPYIANPAAHRLNEPGNLPEIARIAAARKGVPEQKLCEHAYENSTKLFQPIFNHNERK